MKKQQSIRLEDKKRGQKKQMATGEKEEKNIMVDKKKVSIWTTLTGLIITFTGGMVQEHTHLPISDNENKSHMHFFPQLSFQVGIYV